MKKLPDILNSVLELKQGEELVPFTTARRLELKRAIKDAGTVAMVDSYYTDERQTWFDLDSEEEGWLWCSDRAKKVGAAKVLVETALRSLRRNRDFRGVWLLRRGDNWTLVTPKKVGGEYIVSDYIPGKRGFDLF